MTFRERLQASRYNLVPDHIIGEVLTKRWADNAIPFVALVVTVATFGSVIPGFFALYSLQESTRQLGEFSLIVTGLTVVMLGGGIDLSVGSIFALSAFAAVATFFILEQPVWLALAASLASGLLFGALNGYLIGFLRLRAFITTLVTFIIGRAAYDILVVSFGSKIQLSMASSDAWDFVGDGTLLSISVPVLAAIALAIVSHVALTRSRPGWHVLAVGGSRRSAYNSGIRVRQTVFLTYVFSGFCSSAAGFLIATRLSGVGPGTGQGMEILALTAAVVGGNSLGGGRGSIAKGLMGAIIVLVMTNGLIRLGFGSGTNQMALGIMLAAAVILDIRWLKNRDKVLHEVYVAPIYHRMGETHSALPGSGSPYALDDRLAAAEPIGLGELEGPEDVILDEDDHLYCGTRHGEIVRFFAPDYQRSEVFAHTGGFPLGLAFDRDGALKVCVGAMGLYSISRTGEVTRLSAETNRSYRSVIDDARLRDPNDCDIAPDGRIFFTDSTTRYEAHDWALDSIESRATGRLLVYDPQSGRTRTVLDNYRYANGVCIAHDGQSLFFAEILGLSRPSLLVRRAQGRHRRMRDPRHARLSRQHQPRLRRHLLDGLARHAHADVRPRAAQPRHAQAHDPATAAGRMAVPEHQHRRRREVRRDRPYPRCTRRPRRHQPPDGHLDARAQGLPLYRRHPQQPDRPLPDSGRRPGLDRPALLLGPEAMRFEAVLDYLRGQAVTIPPMDGAFRPNTALDEAEVALEVQAPDNLIFDGRRVLFTSGAEILALPAAKGGRPEELARFELAAFCTRRLARWRSGRGARRWARHRAGRPPRWPDPGAARGDRLPDRARMVRPRHPVRQPRLRGPSSGGLGNRPHGKERQRLGVADRSRER